MSQETNKMLIPKLHFKPTKILTFAVLIMFIICKNHLENSIQKLNKATRNGAKNKSDLKIRADSAYEIRYLKNQKPIRTETTVVTTLFQFNKSKHSNKKYDRWSTKMIASMGVPIVAYVDFFWADKFIEKCNKYNLTGTFKIFNYLSILI